MEENSTSKQYELIFELFGSGKQYITLLKELRNAIAEFEPCVPDMRHIGEKRFEIKLVGSLIEIDKRHFLLRCKYFKGLQIICIKDEGGDQLRQEAYPLLSDIEQRVRTFINRIMNEEGGNKWWDDLVNKEYKAKVKGKADNQRYYEHPLENLDFGDLLKLTQHNFTFWNKGEEEVTKELLTATNQASDQDDLKKLFTEILRPRSVWDDVFALHFEDQNEFDKLAGRLDQVIKERNKVMHHRAISCKCLRTLKQNISYVISILDNKLDTVDQAKKLKLKERMDALSKVVSQQANWPSQELPFAWQLLAANTFPLESSISPLAAQFMSSTKFQEDWSKSLAAQFLNSIPYAAQQLAALEAKNKELTSGCIQAFESANEAAKSFADVEDRLSELKSSHIEALGSDKEAAERIEAAHSAYFNALETYRETLNVPHSARKLDNTNQEGTKHGDCAEEYP